MTHIALIRPGLTDYDRQGRIQGQLNVPLTEEGQQQVAKIADSLADRSIDTIYYAPCESAESTAKQLAEVWGSRLKSVEKLANINQGLWQGMLLEDVRRKQPKVYRQWQDNPYSVCPPEGEMLEQACERARAFIRKLLRKNKLGNVAVIVPEPMAAIIRFLLTEEPLGDLWNGAAAGTWECLEVEPQMLAAIS